MSSMTREDGYYCSNNELWIDRKLDRELQQKRKLVRQNNKMNSNKKNKMKFDETN